MEACTNLAISETCGTQGVNLTNVVSFKQIDYYNKLKSISTTIKAGKLEPVEIDDLIAGKPSKCDKNIIDSAMETIKK